MKASSTLHGQAGRALTMAVAAALLAAGLCAGVGRALAAEGEAASAGGLQAAGIAEVQTQAADYDISWYTGKQSPYTVNGLKQLKGLAYLVNSGTETFAGKTVKLADKNSLMMTSAIEPIGTQAHPFQGTFDGNRSTGAFIQGLNLSLGGRLSYVGLFGYAGNGAVIKNLDVRGGSVEVSNSAAGKVISNVGAIAGYLGGSMQNCVSTVEVEVTNNGAVPTKKGTKAEELCTILYVGGLAGTVVGNVENCTHGQVDLKINSTTNVDENVPYIAGFVGGIVGMQGVESKPDNVPIAKDCKNLGPLTFAVTGSGGLDRFGSQMYSKSTMVGGIVGYTMGNVQNCSNAGVIQTSLGPSGKSAAGWGALNVGGIVGSLRGPTVAESASATGVVGSNQTDPGYTVWTSSKGAKKPTTILISNCSNTGAITGLASVAGICGSAGAFSQIVGCFNTATIEGTRWNKPCPAGIAGISNGDILYCYNQGKCFSTTGGGYYASGIVALLTTYNTTSTAQNLRLSDPQLAGCYVTGSIGGSDTGYRTAVLAAENDGFVHDNCFLPNLTVDKVADKSIFGDEAQHSRLVASGENRGTLKNNHELDVAQMKTSLAVAYLNKPIAKRSDWSLYYVPQANGYPKLSWQVAGATTPTVTLESVSAAVGKVESPAYSAAFAPVPSVEVTAKGATLHQDADYKVVVDPNAKEVGVEYQATVQGINGYTGELSQKVTYKIVKAGIDTCTVTCAPAIFNWQRQKPSTITLRDDAGNVVDASEYTFSVPWNSDGSTEAKKIDGKYHYYDYINCHGEGYRYDVVVAANKNSAHYTGETTQQAFQIKWASLFMSSKEVDDPNKEESVKLGNIVWAGKEFDIVKALTTKGFAKFKYTGSEIKPTFKSVMYLGKSLRNGTGQPYYYKPLDYDYRYVYGDPNPEDGKDLSKECVDVTGSAESNLACVCIRYTSGGNFNNYTNVFFEITPADLKSDVSVSGIASTYGFTGKAVTVAPKLTYNGMTLSQGKDYTLSYKNNTAVGKASVTITGKGNYTGSVTREFTIEKANFFKASISAPAQTYTGKALKPAPTVKLDGKTLKAGTDYTVTYLNNVKVGTATVTATGKGSYSGSIKATFAIKAASVASATVKVAAQKYNKGKALKPAPTVKLGGKTLKRGTDYTVTYANNKKAGKATMTIKGKGSYKGTKKATFKIAKAKQPMTVKALTKTVKFAKVKKKAQSVAPLSVKNAQGKVTYKNSSTNKVAKKFKISAKGKVTVPKNTKKGTYKVKIAVKAKGNANYAAATKTVTATIKVK